MNKTKNDAINLAKIYLNRLNSGEYKSYIDMHYDILSNVVNNKYWHCSNLFIDEFWSYIHLKTS